MTTDLQIQQFSSYRTFLVAHAQAMKRNKPKWSYGVWSRALGLKTTSSITKIIQGTREPGTQITEKMIRYFHFNQKQSCYFRDLIRLQKIQHDPRLCVLLLEKMGKEHPDATLRLLNERSFLVISNWYYLALREFCRVRGFKENPEWISSRFRFRVSAKEISQALKALIDLGLLSRDKAGNLQIVDSRLDTSNDIASEAIKRYHEQMLDHAKTAIRSISLSEREITAMSLVMNPEKMDMAKELIREFKSKFERLMEDHGSGTEVYQIQIQLFPLTHSS